MQQLEIETPTPDLVNKWIKKFDAEASVVEKAMKELFEDTFPRNDRLEHIALKVTAIDYFYGTGIKRFNGGIVAVGQLAEQIRQLQIDTQLNMELPRLVYNIANLPIGEYNKNNYSFATKYCSWHKPNAYPIYDGYVDTIIWAYQKSPDYIFGDFKHDELRNYPTFKDIIMQFMRRYRLTGFSFKELDKFLWGYCRCYFDHVGCPGDKSPG